MNIHVGLWRESVSMIGRICQMRPIWEKKLSLVIARRLGLSTNQNWGTPATHAHHGWRNSALKDAGRQRHGNPWHHTGYRKGEVCKEVKCDKSEGEKWSNVQVLTLPQSIKKKSIKEKKKVGLLTSSRLGLTRLMAGRDAPPPGWTSCDVLPVTLHVRTPWGLHRFGAHHWSR